MSLNSIKIIQSYQSCRRRFYLFQNSCVLYAIFCDVQFQMAIEDQAKQTSADLDFRVEQNVSVSLEAADNLRLFVLVEEDHLNLVLPADLPTAGHAIGLGFSGQLSDEPSRYHSKPENLVSCKLPLPLSADAQILLDSGSPHPSSVPFCHYCLSGLVCFPSAVLLQTRIVCILNLFFKQQVLLKLLSFQGKLFRVNCSFEPDHNFRMYLSLKIHFKFNDVF